LKEIDKELDLKKLIKSVKLAVKRGINTRCNLVIGFPRESLRDMLKTLLFQIRLCWIGVDDAPLYIFTPYPGSKLFTYLRQTGRIAHIDDDYFDSLVTQMDLGSAKIYSECVSGGTVRMLRMIGMTFFYLLSYIFRPARLARSLVNIFVKKSTETVFEQRILELLHRRKLL
jgi:radical SAM superfamily enzyme YgiQ (UPF0313 family)